MIDSPRRGWRETVEPGLYRSHRVACASSRDRRPGRRCGCPLQITVPGTAPGATTMLTIRGTLGEARAERRRRLAAGRTEPVAEPAVDTVHDLAKGWFRAGAPRWSPKTTAERDRAYRARIAPTFATMPLVDLSRSVIEAWAARMLAEAQGRRAVELAVEALRAMLGVALEAGLIGANPAARVRLPPPPPRERTAADRVVDRAGAAALIGAARDVRQETIVRAALEAGLRRAEICGLTWPDVRLEERRVVVRQGVYQDAAVGKVVVRPKGGPIGRVAISATFAARLAEWYAASVVEGGASAAGFVWPGRWTGPMSPSSVTHLIAKIGRRAGVVDERGRHRAHLHGLRHSAGSIALSAGVPLTVVSASLRHERPDFTARVYSHVLGDRELDRFAAAHETETVRETVRGSRVPARTR